MSHLTAHPLTGHSGYTASIFRKAVNALILASDNSTFGSIQGVRAGAPTPLTRLDNLTVTIQPHAGVLSPFSGEGAYTYAIDSPTSIDIESRSQNYKIALVLSDPSVGRGSTPQLEARVYSYGTPQEHIQGLVIAEVKTGIISDTAPLIAPQALLYARSVEQLHTIKAFEGQRARILGTTAEYVYRSNNWVDTSKLPVAVYSRAFRAPYTDNGGTHVTLMRVGNIVTVNGNTKLNSIGNKGYETVYESLPAGYRPTANNAAIMRTRGTFTIMCSNYQTGGLIIFGSTNGTEYTSVSGSWVTLDPEPVADLVRS